MADERTGLLGTGPTGTREPEIVFAGVYSSEGLLVHSAVVEQLKPVFNEILPAIDLLVDHRKGFAPNPRTMNHTICLDIEDELCYVCAAEAGLQQRIMFAFLQSIKEAWIRFKKASKKKNSAFAEFLREEMEMRLADPSTTTQEYFSHSADADKIRQLNVKIAQTTDLMLENVDKLLARGEKIDGIISKTENIHSQTRAFKKRANTVKWEMCTRNIKMTICLFITIICAFLALAATGVFLYFFFTKIFPLF